MFIFIVLRFCLYVCEWVCVHVKTDGHIQKALDPLKLKLQEEVSHLTWVLGENSGPLQD